MKYIKLGNSELNVSQICLGCMSFGDPHSEYGNHPWAVDEETSYKVIKKALELGINFFDTAYVYQGGTSEAYLAKALNRLVSRREAVIATKFFGRTKEDAANNISVKELMYNELNKSLKNLNTHYIDLYILHAWDYNTPIEEIMAVLNEIVQSGKVRYIGISNCYAWQLIKANSIAEKNNWSKFISVQGHYNMIFREEEREMLSCCKDTGIAYTPYSPLAGGRLARGYEEITKRVKEDTINIAKYGKTETADRKIIDRMHELADSKNCSYAQLSLAWLLSKGTIPIYGTSKEYQLDGIEKSLDITFSDDELAYLEELYVPHKLVGVMAMSR